jgi:hypothetical protein
MADLWGALAQSAPAATTLTAAYTVPAGQQATIEVVMCNTGAAATVRVQHAVNGAASALTQYLLYDFPLAGADTKVTARFTVRAGDVIRVYSSTGNVTFNVNGIEETA